MSASLTGLAADKEQHLEQARLEEDRLRDRITLLGNDLRDVMVEKDSLRGRLRAIVRSSSEYLHLCAADSYHHTLEGVVKWLVKMCDTYLPSSHLSLHLLSQSANGTLGGGGGIRGLFLQLERQ